MGTISLLRNSEASNSILSKLSVFSRKLFTSIIKSTPVETTLQPQSTTSNIGDIEGMAHDANQGVLDAKLTEESELLIQQAIQLIECLCKIMASVSHKEAADIYVDATLMATELGSSVVVEQIVKAFPGVIYCSSSSKQSILHVAAQNRSVDVFNLIYQKGLRQKYSLLDTIDSNGNNLLHAAAKLAPFHKLNEVSGAAWQMRREMDWYKMVERIVHPNCKDQQNQSGRTPKMVFEGEHEKLKEEAKQGTRDTVNSCLVAAALIVGVTFAGFITVPGGYDNSSGLPIFSKKGAFLAYMIFISNSLTMAIYCLLVLLFISFSHYADHDDLLLERPGEIKAVLVVLLTSVALLILSCIPASMLIWKSGALVLAERVFWPLLIIAIFIRTIGSTRLRSSFGYGTIKIR